MNTLHENLSFFRSMRGKLLLWFLALAIIPLVAVGLLSYFQAQRSLEDAASAKLEAVQSIKKTQIEEYFAERQSDTEMLAETVESLRNSGFDNLVSINSIKADQVRFLFEEWEQDVLDVSSDPRVGLGVMDLSSAFESIGADRVRSFYQGKETVEDTGDGSDYSAAHFEQHGFFLGYIEIHGYEDAFLIDRDGNVVYSTQKGSMFGSNLTTGPYQESNLAELFRALESAPLGQIYVADIDPLAEEKVMYMGTPTYTGTTWTGILDEIQRATNAAVMATEEGTKGVDVGVEQTEQTGDTIQQLATSVDESAAAAQQIVASAQQQTTGMEQIALAMQNINQATVQSLASTRQAEKATQDLASLAKQMEHLVARYMLN